LAPSVPLRFVRIQPPLRGLAIAYAVLVRLAWYQLSRNDSVPGIFYLVFLLISAVSALLPYIADRLLRASPKGNPRHTGFPHHLGRHAFIYAQGPLGSWGSIAYTQSGDLPLLQLLSVTGLWGITFLIGWFAAAANQCLAAGIQTQRSWRGLTLFGSVYLAVMLLGGLRLAVFPPTSPTVRVASYRRKRPALPSSDGLVQDVVAGRARPTRRSASSVPQLKRRRMNCWPEANAKRGREQRWCSGRRRPPMS